MRKVSFDKDGYRHKWVVNGTREDACIADIEANKLTQHDDYTATIFAVNFGCKAELQSLRLMSHNQYQAYMQHNANRLATDANYTLDDYRRDAQAVEVLPFQLDNFKLDDSIQEAINRHFGSISYTPTGDAVLRCHVGSTVSADLIAQELGCDTVCHQGFNGFYKNDGNKFILEFCDCAVSLIACSSQKSYAAHLADINRYYNIEDFDVCLEVYFDNVHMDNLFLSRENVSVAISSLIQRGYDGYNPAIKDCWEEYLAQKKTPNLSFRVVEMPSMVKDVGLDISRPSSKGINDILQNAFDRSAASETGRSEVRNHDFMME